MSGFLAHSPTSPIEKDIDGGGEGTLAPAGIRHSFIRVPFVDGYTPCAEKVDWVAGFAGAMFFQPTIR